MEAFVCVKLRGRDKVTERQRATHLLPALFSFASSSTSCLVADKSVLTLLCGNVQNRALTSSSNSERVLLDVAAPLCCCCCCC